ncbi:MAG: DNA polymerase III subunit beta [Rikenellaceae bacterium]|jgi:DNA polymerase-3 subunit beta|nr:DNA polymerase III subunit beta [Rikenellaceae bacterium]
MKFVVSSTALLNLLQATGKVISTRNTLPILDYFLFELSDNMLRITASDLETTLIGKLAIDQVEQEGVIAVPAKRVLDTLREFPEQPLTIEANESTWEVSVIWKSGKLTIPGTSGLSYPKPAQVEEAESHALTLAAESLLGGIEKTIFATADDEMRPVMNGIFMNIEGETLTFVATDAHKLVKNVVDGIGSDITASFILPKKPANLVKGILPKEEGDIRIEFDKKNVVFTLSKYTMVCRLIEGTYPNYNAVIPVANPNKVTVDRAELISSIKRVAVCSNPSTNLIKLDITNDLIRLTAQDIDFSVSAEESMACSYEGDSITIGFKSTFLGELLSNLETEQIVIELADSTRAGVFKPVEVETGNREEVLMLLMPMIINS